MRQVSRGKLGRLRCTPAGFTAATLDGDGLRGLWPTRPDATASLSGSCPSGRIFAIASFRRHLAVPPLRVACPSPPSGWAEDLHLPVTKHARHTRYSRRAVLPAASTGAAWSTSAPASAPTARPTRPSFAAGAGASTAARCGLTRSTSDDVRFSHFSGPETPENGAFLIHATCRAEVELHELPSSRPIPAGSGPRKWLKST